MSKETPFASAKDDSHDPRIFVILLSRTIEEHVWRHIAIWTRLIRNGERKTGCYVASTTPKPTVHISVRAIRQWYELYSSEW